MVVQVEAAVPVGAAVGVPVGAVAVARAAALDAGAAARAAAPVSARAQANTELVSTKRIVRRGIAALHYTALRAITDRELWPDLPSPE